MGKFVTGPQVVSFSRASQEPIKLLESITPLEMASCVPFVRITQIDLTTGRQVEGSRPIMADLMTGQQFGEPTERFLERALVSLKTIEIKTTLSYGEIQFREISITFRVHKPELVFSRDNNVAWRTLMDEGTSHMLEYGWVADQRVIKNPLFNGVGYKGDIANQGLAINSIEALLLLVNRYEITLTPSGEVDVVIHALENGEMALRETRLGWVFDEPMPEYPDESVAANDEKALKRTKDLYDKQVGTWKKKIMSRVSAMIKSLPKIPSNSYGDRVKLIDILNTMVAGPVDIAARTFGYRSVMYFAGNFNKFAGLSSPEFGSVNVAGISIGEFLVPVKVLDKVLIDMVKIGKDLTLMNFLKSIVNMMNNPDAWAPATTIKFCRPQVSLRFKTQHDPTTGETDLIVHFDDRQESLNPIDGPNRLDLDKQTRSNVFKKLSDMKIPILEFGSGKSLIIDASFQIQPDPLLQSIQVERAYASRKTQSALAGQPDPRTREGYSRPRELIPFSTLEGSITMVGNFVFDMIGTVWIEFFGAKQVSGIFNVLEKTDTIEPGRFRSQYKMLSTGLDPLNTRLRKSAEEFAKEEKQAAALLAKTSKAKKKSSRKK